MLFGLLCLNPTVQRRVLLSHTVCGDFARSQFFNWAVELCVGVKAIACAEYFVHAREYYQGPVAKVEGRS